MGNPRGDFKIYSLHRRLDCRRDAHRFVDGHFDGVGRAHPDVTLFASLDLLIGNVMEPWLYGKNTGVSPVAVLVAAVFWTWLWGAVGLLLATPLTVCLMVLGKYVPQLSFLDILLGNDEVFEPSKRVYQRLLAGDQEESSELIDGYREQMPLAEVYDTVLIPALAMTETHWQRGEINDERHKLIFQNLKETVDELGEREKEIQTKEAGEEVKEIRWRSRFTCFDECIDALHSLPACATRRMKLPGRCSRSYRQ